MPYSSGSWGKDEQERSKRRIEYFRAYQRRRYVEKSEELKEKSKEYYAQHSDEITERVLLNYYKGGQISRRVNPEVANKRSREYYQHHREERKSQFKEYYRKHAEEINAKRRAKRRAKAHSS